MYIWRAIFIILKSIFLKFWNHSHSSEFIVRWTIQEKSSIQKCQRFCFKPRNTMTINSVKKKKCRNECKYTKVYKESVKPKNTELHLVGYCHNHLIPYKSKKCSNGILEYNCGWRLCTRRIAQWKTAAWECTLQSSVWIKIIILALMYKN